MIIIPEQSSTLERLSFQVLDLTGQPVLQLVVSEIAVSFEVWPYVEDAQMLGTIVFRAPDNQWGFERGSLREHKSVNFRRTVRGVFDDYRRAQAVTYANLQKGAI